MGTAHPNDDLLDTEAELDRRTAKLLLIEIEDALEEMPTECLTPEEHERAVAIAEEVTGLKNLIEHRE